jgi:hypothetical protein
MCIDVERKGINPFEVEITEILQILKKHLPHWTALDDFMLDAEAINRIASIITLQGDWIKHRSTSLYIDPLLLEFKIKTIDAKQLVEIFRKIWHPIVEFEALTKKRVNEAIEYWNLLLPFEERRLSLPPPVDNLKSTSFEELLKQKIISEKPFNEALHELWHELKASSKENEQVSYWTFIQANTYEETVYRAYMTSFLITYGYASMTIDPIEEEAFITPFQERQEALSKIQSVSIPIAINYETWKRRSEEES